MSELEQAIIDWDGVWDNRPQVLIDFMERNSESPMIKAMTYNHYRHIEQMKRLEKIGQENDKRIREKSGQEKDKRIREND